MNCGGDINGTHCPPGGSGKGSKSPRQRQQSKITIKFKINMCARDLSNIQLTARALTEKSKKKLL